MKTFQILLRVYLVLTVLLFVSCVKSDNDTFDEPAYTGWAVGDMYNGYGVILHTANDGISWQRQGTSSFLSGMNFYDVSVMNTSEVWVVGDSIDGYATAWFTSNGGNDWSREGDTTVFGGVNLRAVWAKNGKRVWVAGDQGTLCYTDNSGSTWNTITIDSLYLARFTVISGDSTNIVWVAGNNFDTTGAETAPLILRSADGGATFIHQSLGAGFAGHIYDLSVVDDSTAWLAAGAYLFVTYDAGTSWQQAHTAISGHFHSVCADSLETVWAGGEGGTMYHLSAGVWNSLNPNGGRYTINGITMANANRVWATGINNALTPRGTVIYTHTTGISWFIEPNPSWMGMHRVSFAKGVR
jgi:photosystem II stability/assembly factor-like uncharacterized protein